MEDLKNNNHKVIIENREKITISGAVDVESFDEREISVYTTEGAVVLYGDDFKINRLNVDSGDVEIEGYINEFKYTGADKSEGGSIWSKIFK